MKRILLLPILILLANLSFAQVIYDGSSSALITGEEWYTFGNENFSKTDHPLYMTKETTSAGEEEYVGVGNARYGEAGEESFGLYGKPGESHLEITLSASTNFPSNFEIRLRTLDEEEFSYFIATDAYLDYTVETVSIPLTSFRSLTNNLAPTLEDIQNFSNLTFVFGFYFADSDVSFSVSNVTFETTTEQCTAPDSPNLSASSKSSICLGETTTLSVESGSLNDALHWRWYTGSCGGTAIGTGPSITVAPEEETTYYVRGEGGCVSAGSCTKITISVMQAVTPSVSITPSTTEACKNDLVMLAAETSGAGISPNYLWKINNMEVGVNTNVLMTEELEDGDVVHVEVTSSEACATPKTVSSSSVTMGPCVTSLTKISASDSGIKSLQFLNGTLRVNFNEKNTSRGQIVVTNLTGQILGKINNVDASAGVVEFPSLNEEGLLIVTFVTDKEVFVKKGFSSK